MRRRKKSARSEESDSSGNLNLMKDLNKGRSFFCETRRWKGFLDCVHRHLQASKWVAAKPSPIST